MFYLNRGALPEGPFDEARIVHMIRSGELTQAFVCPVGYNQWWQLNQIPVFAEALAERARAMTGYGPPPGYGPAPQAPGYGPAPQAPGYGPAPSGYGPGPAASAYAVPRDAVPARKTVPEGKKQGSRALLLIGLLAILFLFLVSSAIGAYLLFFSKGGAPQMAACMPRDSEMLIEIASVPKLVADFKKVEYLDTSLRDDKKMFDDTADSVAKAFDISLGDARSLLVASRSVAFAARKLASEPEAAFAIGFTSAGPVDTLLKSPRFVASGALGQTGKRYQLVKRQLQSSAGQDLLLKELTEAELGTGKEVLVWFPNKHLLCFGSDAFVSDLAKVIEGGAAAIDQNPSFRAAAKDFEENARLTVYVDPSVFSTIDDPKVKELVDSYFKPAGPLTGALTVTPGGFVTSLSGRIIGSKLPKGSSYEAPAKLALADRLPVETLSYVDLQTRTKMTGIEVQRLLLEQLESVNPRSGRDADRGLAELEQLLGVSLAKLIDGLGGEGALAFAAPANLTADPSLLGQGARAAANFDLIWVQELKDDAEYRRLAQQLKQKLLPSIRELNVTEDGPGFTISPRGAPFPVSLRVKFFDKHLFVTAGGNALCDRAEAAFSKGDRTLKDDAAHQAALAALPERQHVRIWIDTGRVADTLFKNPLLRARATENGMQLEKFRLSGPQRVTSALSVRTEVQNEVWTYRVDALNLQALAPLGLGAMSLGGIPGRSALPPL